MGSTCDEGGLGEGCFLERVYEPTKGKVGNIFIVTLGFYRPTMDSQAMLDA